MASRRNGESSGSGWRHQPKNQWRNGVKMSKWHQWRIEKAYQHHRNVAAGGLSAKIGLSGGVSGSG
jgi:hypothetical protein